MNISIDQSRPLPVDMTDEYSVVIPIIEEDAKLYLLYEMRSLTLKTQPGEVCFPGGALDSGETPLQCGMRECHEELGIAFEKIQYLGESDFCFIGSTLLNAFIVKLDLSLSDIPNLEINREEVEQVFAIPLEFFKQNKPDEYFLNANYSHPEDYPHHLIPNGKNYKYRFNQFRTVFYQYEDKTIWGLTAKLTEAAIKRIHI